MSIRTATEADLESIVGIYNEAIDIRTATADIENVTIDEKKDWFSEHLCPQYPILIKEIDSQVVAWSSLSKYRLGRGAFRKTVEVSYYVANAFKRQGIATELLKHSIDKSIALGYSTLIAILLEPNIASIEFLKKFGFKEWGRMPKIAEIDGEKYDHIYMGLTIR